MDRKAIVPINPMTSLSHEVILNHKDATETFHRFPPAMQLASLHPDYLALDARRDPDLQPMYFVYEDSEGIYYHTFHRVKIGGTDRFDIQSSYGYGGPIATNSDPKFLEKAWQASDEWCRSHGVIAQFLRFHPLLENWNFYDGSLHFNRTTVWVDLQRPLGESYEQRVRTSLRKAAAVMEVSVVPMASVREQFSQLYADLMRQINASPFYLFSEAYFRALADWDRTLCIVCHHEGRLAGGALFLCGEESMEYHLSAANEVGKKYAATALLLHKASEYGQLNGYNSLHLGGGSDSGPGNKLLFFKQGFSNKNSSFYVGTKVLDSVVYQNLRDEWTKSGKVVNDRILFYR